MTATYPPVSINRQGGWSAESDRFILGEATPPSGIPRMRKRSNHPNTISATRLRSFIVVNSVALVAGLWFIGHPGAIGTIGLIIGVTGKIGRMVGNW
jgi:hypothetical protein